MPRQRFDYKFTPNFLQCKITQNGRSLPNYIASTMWRCTKEDEKLEKSITDRLLIERFWGGRIWRRDDRWRVIDPRGSRFVVRLRKRLLFLETRAENARGGGLSREKGKARQRSNDARRRYSRLGWHARRKRKEKKRKEREGEGKRKRRKKPGCSRAHFSHFFFHWHWRVIKNLIPPCRSIFIRPSVQPSVCPSPWSFDSQPPPPPRSLRCFFRLRYRRADNMAE